MSDMSETLAPQELTLADIPPLALDRMVRVPADRGWMPEGVMKWAMAKSAAPYARRGTLFDPLGWTKPRSALFYPVVLTSVLSREFGFVRYGEPLGLAWAEPQVGHLFTWVGASRTGSRLRVAFEDMEALA